VGDVKGETVRRGEHVYKVGNATVFGDHEQRERAWLTRV
jgi:hypothetical protein